MTAAPVVAFLDRCLDVPQQMMHGTMFEYMIQRYFYPILALFGIFGNILNLTVLLNKNMRSRANTFLSMLAFADIIFLLLLFPNILANYAPFTFNFSYRWVYFHAKIHILALANWCSAIAIWCVILVCTDRLIGIRSPLYARGGWGRGRMPALLTLVVLITGSLTAYQHFEYDCPVRVYCNYTQVQSKCKNIGIDDIWFRSNETNPYSSETRTILNYSTLAFLMTMIIAPIVLLTVLNSMLLCALRQRHQQFAVNGNSISGDTKRDSNAFQKTEHRVTLTVTCIVTMFTITNGPSALWHLIATLYPSLRTPPPKVEEQTFFTPYNITMICSTLVICGKASNFILFCLGSKHFRMRLLKLAQRKVHKKMGRITVTSSSSARMALGLLGKSSSFFTRIASANKKTAPMRKCSTLPGALVDLLQGEEHEEQQGGSIEAISSGFEHYRSRRLSGPSGSSNSPKISTSITISSRPRTRSSVGSVERPLIGEAPCKRKYSQFAPSPV